MNVGIIGLPQTGKKSLFSLLVGEAALPAHADARQSLRGVAEVEDRRFDRIVEIYKPRKLTRARLNVVVMPKMEEQAVSQGNLFKDMGEIDAFVHVARAFEDESVYHIWGDPDPAREIEYVHSEFVLHDLVFVEKRLERIDANLQKVKDERQAKEKQILERLRTHLEEEKPLRLLEIPPEERKFIASYPLLTLRDMIVALNVSDDQLGDTALVGGLRSRFESLGLSVVAIAVAAEKEIAQLETEDERREFMAEMGIEDTALHILTRMCIDALGFGSFFTAGPNEVRQWFFRRGALAPQVAGTIHSDMERGFIRAEMMKFDELAEAGSEDALKAAGKFHVKGKDYAVEDGDVLFIRFNV